MRDTGTWRAMEELYEQGLVKAGSKAFGLRFKDLPKHPFLLLGIIIFYSNFPCLAFLIRFYLHHLCYPSCSQPTIVSYGFPLDFTGWLSRPLV